MIRYQESNIKVIFHNISYNFLLILQVKQPHPVGFSEHINLDYIYLLETIAYKAYAPSCVPGGPDGPDQALSLGVSVPRCGDTQRGLEHRENPHHGMNFAGTKDVSSVDSVSWRRREKGGWQISAQEPA